MSACCFSWSWVCFKYLFRACWTKNKYFKSWRVLWDLVSSSVSAFIVLLFWNEVSLSLYCTYNTVKQDITNQQFVTMLLCFCFPQRRTSRCVPSPRRCSPATPRMRLSVMRCLCLTWQRTALFSTRSTTSICPTMTTLRRGELVNVKVLTHMVKLKGMCIPVTKHTWMYSATKRYR